MAVLPIVGNDGERQEIMAYVSSIKTRQVTPGTGPGIDRLQALQAFNARLVCMTVNESSYDEVVNGVWKVLGCDACALFLLDEGTDDLVLKASVGYDGCPGRSADLPERPGQHARPGLQRGIPGPRPGSRQFGRGEVR